MKRVLFQGDSITDCGRDRNNDSGSGTGYPCMIAGRSGYSRPGNFEFLNRGISGNTVASLYSRWRTDCLNLKPDYLSILIGVNDVWHGMDGGNGVGAERYRDIYNMLIEDTVKSLPEIKIMLMEPYLLYGPSTAERWEYFSEEVLKRREITNNIADKYNFPVVHLQKAFDEAIKKAPANHWSGDGVHPTLAGHGLITDIWINEFSKNFEQIE